MNRYGFDAINKNGEVVNGDVSAESVSAAVLELEEKGLQVQAIRMVPADEESQARQETHWLKQLDETIQQRTKWLPALQAMVDELPRGRTKKDTARLVNLLQGELSSEELLASRELIQVLPLLTTGRESSNTGERLQGWLSELVRQRQKRRQRWRSITYPAVLLALAIALLAVLSAFLIPVFKSMFDEFGLFLPQITQIVIWVSDQITIYFARTVLVVLSCSGIVFAIVFLWRRFALTNRLLGRIVSGTSSNLSAMSNLTSTLAELLSLDAPLPNALEISGRSCGHAYFADVAEKVAASVRRGLLVKSESAARKLPPCVLHALSLENGPNVPLLRELAAMYSDRSRSRTDWISTILPAGSVLIVGIIVGFIVIALFVPLITLVTALS